VAFFNPERFAVRKEPGSFRIFCIGGSTTFGHPYDRRTSYPRWLQAYLEEAEPEIDWQVINAGGISYASDRLAVLMDELVQYQPDLFVVHNGHNEFLEDRSYHEIRDRGAVLSRALALASHSRVFGLLQSMPGLGPEPVDPRLQLPAEVTPILERTDGPETYHRDPRVRQDVLELFRISLERIVATARRSGADVILVQPASNLKDFSPFKSEHVPLAPPILERWTQLYESGRREVLNGELAAGLRSLQEAEALDPYHADGLYLLGRALFTAGRHEAAEGFFVRAKDEDVAPLRALSDMRPIIARVATRNDLQVVDFENLLRDFAIGKLGHPVLGEELFLDHVHPTIEGHGLLGRALFDAVRAARGLEPRPIDSAAESRIAATIAGTVGLAERARALHTLALTLSWAGKTEEALKASNGAMELQPTDSEIVAMNGQLLEQVGRSDQALARLRSAVELDPEDGVAVARLGDFYGRTGQYEAARIHLERAIELSKEEWPVSFQSILHVRLGKSYEYLGDRAAARRAFERALQIDPDSTEARRHLERLGG
jgi:tetratricopeptide (TPR) repeat protein